MNVSLTPELQKFVGQKVKSGRYRSASDVIQEGLKLLEDEERLRDKRLKEIRHKIQIGLDELNRGEGLPGEEVFQELKRRSQSLRRSRR
jgi:antitoxin ParD1/3/4